MSITIASRECTRLASRDVSDWAKKNIGRLCALSWPSSRTNSFFASKPILILYMEVVQKHLDLFTFGSLPVPYCLYQCSEWLELSLKTGQRVNCVHRQKGEAGGLGEHLNDIRLRYSKQLRINTVNSSNIYCFLGNVSIREESLCMVVNHAKTKINGNTQRNIANSCTVVSETLPVHSSLIQCVQVSAVKAPHYVWNY